MQNRHKQPRTHRRTKVISSLTMLIVLLGLMASTQSCDKVFDNKPCMDIRRESTVLTIAVNGEGNQVECIVNDGERYVVNGGDSENCPATILFQGTAQVTIVDATNNVRIDTVIEANGPRGVLYSTMETKAERCSCAP